MQIHSDPTCNILRTKTLQKDVRYDDISFANRHSLREILQTKEERRAHVEIWRYQRIIKERDREYFP